jgi:hypothetical protein
MLSGKFATGTTTLCGQGGEINFDLIQGASLALSPQHRGILTETLPASGVTQLFASAGRTGVGRES